jgi:hypothetical protein
MNAHRDNFRVKISDTFISTWNGFVGKTSSLPEDMHGILANLLDLDATEVLKLPIELRMKAIFNSLQSIPIGILVDAPPESVLGTCSSPLDHDALWLPRFPGELGY